MRCRNCGVEVIAGAAFCPSCGRPVACEPTSVRRAVASPRLPQNIAGALCYLASFVTGALFLALQAYRDDRFVRFHAFQATFLGVICFVAYIVISVLAEFLPGMLRPAVWSSRRVLGFGLALLTLLLMNKACKHERLKLPVIGELAEEQA
jgi:uncharacterized membrane protein